MSRSKNYVVGFLFSTDRTQLALVQKEKPDWQKGRWNGIGGKIEEGENPIDCMTREFEEETGVRIPPESWEEVVVLHNDWFECHFFRAFSDNVHFVETREAETISLWDVTRVLSGYCNVINNLRWLVPLMLDDGLHLGKDGQVLRIKDGKPNG